MELRCLTTGQTSPYEEGVRVVDEFNGSDPLVG